MARSEGLSLDREFRPARKGLLHLLGIPADDHNQATRCRRLGSRQTVVEQRSPAQRVQHLGQIRLHTGALAGGENDHGGFPGSRAHGLSSSATRTGTVTTQVSAGQPRKRGGKRE